MIRLFLPCLLVIPCLLHAQKEIYIPSEWQQPNGLDYSFEHSAQSDNFIIFWGPLAGDDPSQAPSEINFDPQHILLTAEDLYNFYIDTIQFVNDETGLISQYKIILVMLHTWPGIEGWAFGGNYDATVGAMWMHPHAASSGPTLAHEFTHTLQNYTWMMNPGHGFIDSSYVGFFWETHAEFMALQRYPSVALEFDMARWLNTCQFHWSSTRHHYQAFVFLQYIKEKDGITMINRMWNEANIGEHPLQTYKRLTDIDQETLNYLFADYAMRNVTWDYEIGSLLRERVSTLDPKFLSHPTFIPESVDTILEWYRIPNHLAPQDYGYNIIRLYPEQNENCEKRKVHLHFGGQVLLPGYEEAGWRYGFVAVNQNLQPRYSEIYSGEEELVFELNDDETELYLVVTGAPKHHHNYQWEIGFPKIYRYPYEFRIKNAWPEGFQPDFHRPETGIQGAPHSNGGGFVASTAFADATAYIGPNAKVLDQARILGNAKVEDFAVVQNNALVEENASISGKTVIGENAHVFGNARVMDEAQIFGGCIVYDDAIVKGNALIFFTSVYDQARVQDNAFCWGAALHGDISIGGDAEFFSECSDGTYLQVEWAYNRNCDGLDVHPSNENLTSSYGKADIENQFTLICDSLFENQFLDLQEFICEGDTFLYYDMILTMPGLYKKVFRAVSGADSIVTLYLDHLPLLEPILTGPICKGDTIYVYGYPVTEPGPYDLYIDTFECGVLVHVNLHEVVADTSVAHMGNSLMALGQNLLFQWFDCNTGMPVPGAIQRDFIPSVSGHYKVLVTTIEGCTAFSDCYFVSTVSIAKALQELDFKIVPNPATKLLHVVFTKLTNEEIHLEVMDVTGVVRQQQKTFREDQEIELNVSELPQGLYFLKLTDSSGKCALWPFIKSN